MPSPPDITIEVFGKTDVGLIREHNEDNFLVADVTAGMRTNDIKEALKVHLGEKGALFLVCDGMGGAAAGEVASRMAVESIFDVLAAVEPQDRDGFARAVRHAIEVANERIYVQSRDNQSERGMGTTCTAAALVDQTLVVGQIGDSRCYVFRGDKLAQVTKDQSLAWQLIEAGAMTAEEAKAFEHANIILQALGVQERVEVVLSQVALRQGDLVVLCSDGLHGPVGDDEMLEMLQREPDLQKAAEGLIQKALDRDGPDNITVVIARFSGAALVPATAEDLVTFVPYDPGPGPEGDPASESSLEHPIVTTSTVNERVPQELLSDEAVTAGVAERSGQSSSSASGSAIRTARSVLAFFFLALVAAAAGGIFVMKCEREQAAHSSTSEGRGGKP
jgi:serine/threonine protein phosphatase PrpC